ncbi:hypothetical protein RIF29_38361 [Crotalaria pallida]|uniref:Uncharacterized protein n=1 Tax=Crotalaria pallida TaxID=3830 RepID=A0AAN9DZ27_CROPI
MDYSLLIGLHFRDHSVDEMKSSSYDLYSGKRNMHKDLMHIGRIICYEVLIKFNRFKIFLNLVEAVKEAVKEAAKKAFEASFKDCPDDLLAEREVIAAAVAKTRKYFEDCQDTY